MVLLRYSDVPTRNIWWHFQRCKLSIFFWLAILSQVFIYFYFLYCTLKFFFHILFCIKYWGIPSFFYNNRIPKFKLNPWRLGIGLPFPASLIMVHVRILEASLNGDACFVFPFFFPIGCRKDMVTADWMMRWKPCAKGLDNHQADLAALYIDI